MRSPLDGRCEATAVASTSADTTIAKATALSAVVSYHCASSYLLGVLYAVNANTGLLSFERDAVKVVRQNP